MKPDSASPAGPVAEADGAPPAGAPPAGASAGDPAPPRRKAARSPVLALLALALGGTGLCFALWPAAMPSLALGDCPYLHTNGWLAWLPAAVLPHLGGLPLYSPEELAKGDGSDPEGPLLLAINGDVFDVKEKGAQFYAANSPYNAFAGRDSTRPLSLGSMSQADLDRGGDVSDFTPQQMKAMQEQHEFYKGKYPLVGRLLKRRG